MPHPMTKTFSEKTLLATTIGIGATAPFLCLALLVVPVHWLVNSLPPVGAVASILAVPVSVLMGLLVVVRRYRAYRWPIALLYIPTMFTLLTFFAMFLANALYDDSL